MPRIPDVAGEPIVWTVALIGGLGGTLTVLCYGYWLREDGRTSPDDLRACRIDLGASYAVTALFGIAMMIVGATVHVEGEGTTLLVQLSQKLGEQLGPAGKWLFLVGTCGTVFASMLGVWQSAPYLFADCWRLIRDPRGAPVAVDRRAAPYRMFLVVLALVPMIGLFFSFREVQKFYTVIGAYVFPLLAAHAARVQRPQELGWRALQESTADGRGARRRARILHRAGGGQHRLTVAITGALANHRRLEPIMTKLSRIPSRKNIDPTLPRHESLVHMLLAAVDAHPDVTAVIYQERRITYAEFGRATAGLAAKVASLGAGRGSRVIIMMANSIEMDVALMAAMATGAQVATVNPFLTQSELSKVLADVDAALVISDHGRRGEGRERREGVRYRARRSCWARAASRSTRGRTTHRSRSTARRCRAPTTSR